MLASCGRRARDILGGTFLLPFPIAEGLAYPNPEERPSFRFPMSPNRPSALARIVQSWERRGTV